MANGKAGAPRSRFIHDVGRNKNGIVFAVVSDTFNGPKSMVNIFGLNKWERGRVLKHHLQMVVDVRKHSDDDLYEMIVSAVDARGADPFPVSGSEPSDPSDPPEPSGSGDPSDTVPSGAGQPGHQGQQGDPAGAGDPSAEPVIQGESSAPSVSASSVDPGSVEWATVQYVDERVQGVADNANAAIGALVENVNAGFTDMVERMNYAVGSATPRTVTIQLPSVDPVTFTGGHHLLPRATARVAAKMYLMLYGPAGTGKSWMAHDIARALGVECREISVTIQTQDWRINGANTATSFIRGVARECYEHGGLLLIDEFDNGSPNFLAGLNLLLSSDTYTFADGVTVDRHPQFYVVATANTIGEGGTAQYRARQALDAATLDRFTFMRVDLDPSIEEGMAAQYLEDVSLRADLLRVVRIARQNVSDHNLRVVITPRATLDGAKMLALGESMEDVVRDRLTRGCSDDVAQKIMSGTGIDV